MYCEGKLQSLACTTLNGMLVSYLSLHTGIIVQKNEIRTYMTSCVLFKVIFYMKDNCLANDNMQNFV